MAKNGFTEADLLRIGLVQQPDGTYKKGQPKPIPKKRPGKKPHKQVMLEIYEDREKNTGGEELVFSWGNKHISLNEWYSSKHWTERNKTTEYWHNFFKSFLYHPYPRFDKYGVSLEYNSRLDPSNTITMIKLCEDMLQKEGVIENDNKQYCEGIIIQPNEEMKKFTYKLTFYNLKS